MGEAFLMGQSGKSEQSKTATPTASGFTVIPDTGKTLKEVIINGDVDLIAANIKKGVNIFGVTGVHETLFTYESGSASSLSATTYTVTLAKEAVAIFAWGRYAPKSNVGAQGGGFLLIGGTFQSMYALNACYVTNISYNSTTKQVTFTVNNGGGNLDWAAIEKE